jgi:beta-xylosidase
VLLHNDGILPLGSQVGKRILVVGPTASDSLTLLGCYSFPGHVGSLHPDVPIGIEIPTVLEALQAEFAQATVTYTQGASVDGDDTRGIEPAVTMAREHDIVVALLGDRAGLFGRGTSGEGCDAANMKLPGHQQTLLERLLDSGTPVVLGLIEGRPYSLGTAPERAAAIVTSSSPEKRARARLPLSSAAASL